MTFYLCKFAKWKDQDFDSKYGAVFEGLRKDKKSSIGYPLIFISRRILFAVVAIFTVEYPSIQLGHLLLLSSLQFMYLILYKPFEEPLMQKLEVFNEVCEILLGYVLLTFSDANSQLAPSEVYMDYSFLVVAGFNIAVQLFFLVKDSVVSGKDYCKAKCCKKTVVAKPEPGIVVKVASVAEQTKE